MDPNGMNSMIQQMSMPLSMPMNVTNTGNSGVGAPMQMGMPMNSMNPMHHSGRYGVHTNSQSQILPPSQQRQTQQVMMNSMNMNPAMMNMKMNSIGNHHSISSNPQNSNGMNVSNMELGGGVPVQNMGGADWRIQVTREHRANLIAKLYNEMVRLSVDPPPGIKLWMNVAVYELQLYKDASTQEEYITKIFNRLKHLRQQPTDPSAAMIMQTLPSGGTLSRLDFSCYSNNMNPFSLHGGPQNMGGMQGHGSYGNAQYPGQTPGHNKGQIPANMAQHGMAPKDGSGPRMQGSNGPGSSDGAAEYWHQHAAMKAKYRDDVEKVHNAFKKYVDHMKDQDETDQKKKLRYLLSYVQLCASVLSEDKSTHQPRKLEELGRVYKYIVKIVNPYLKKLRSETDKRVHPSGTGLSITDPNGNNLASNPSNQNPHQGSQMQSQSAAQSQATGQHQYQQQLQQQRQQQLQQQQLQLQRQQHMQLQRQQQMMHQQSIQSNNSQQAPSQHNIRPNPQSQHPMQSGQSNSNNQQNSSPSVSNSQSSQSQNYSTKHSNPSRPQNGSPPLSSGFGISLGDDNSYYASMDSSLLQMSSNDHAPATSASASNTTSSTSAGTSNSLMNYSMGFSSELSPSGFPNSADLEFLDIDGSALNYDGQENASHSATQGQSSANTASSTSTNGKENSNSASSGKDPSQSNDNSENSDLMTFVEAL